MEEPPTLPTLPSQSMRISRFGSRLVSSLFDSEAAAESFGPSHRVRSVSMRTVSPRRPSSTMVDVAPHPFRRESTSRVVPLGAVMDRLRRTASVEARVSSTVRSSGFSRYASAITSRLMPADERVVKYGLSLPMIFIFSVAIATSYTMAFLSEEGVEWIPRDLTGDTEWKSTTRTHLAQDPHVLLDDLLSTATIGIDTSVSVNFLAKYGVANEANEDSTTGTFNKTWLDPTFIMANGFTIAGQMAGAFEGYGVWPCAVAIARHPIVATVCANPSTDWFAIQIYNNPVATSSEKASTYLSLSFTPLALMTARIWPATAPKLIDDGIVVHGYKQGTYTQREFYVLKLEQGQLAAAQVKACDRTTQSNALECDRLESEDIYVRNFASRDYKPLTKLSKVQVYGPAYAMGNYVAADKNFVQLPAVAIVMTNAGYSASTRFSTNLPFRLTILHGKLTTEYSISQIATYTAAVGRSFAAAAYQMIIVCCVVFNSIAHCRTNREAVAREGMIFGFKNHVTMGIVARRLGSYKLVAIQLCVYHTLNVRKYLAAVYYNTQKTTDMIAFTSEGVLLMVVSTMLLDQLIFLERYSSVRETVTVILSCVLYVVHLHVNMHLFLSIEQVQVTELAVCAGANQCYLVHGLRYYYVGLLVCLLLPVMLVYFVVHRWVVPTRAPYPKAEQPREKLTSFERYCVGLDSRFEFGAFERTSMGTPISIVHAAGFTYVGSYLVRIKDYYLVVLGRQLPEPIIKSSGLTLSLFRIKDGQVVAGRHMLLAAAYKYFRETHMDNYAPIR